MGQNNKKAVSFVADAFDRVYSEKDTSGNAKNSKEMSLLDRMRVGLKNQFAPALFSAKEMELLMSEEINPDDSSACAQYLNINQACHFQNVVVSRM